MSLIKKGFFAVVIGGLCATTTLAAPKAMDGWRVHHTAYSFADLIDRVKDATKSNGMGVVTQAGPTGAAAQRGITIPGNRVIGIFNNTIAVKMLGASVNAMIEAPVRMYITEEPDGTAVLSYKSPSHVFAPYKDDSPAVMDIAATLDETFAKIAAEAIE